MKYHKFNIGDKVRHRENPLAEFEVIDILSPFPEKKGEHLYKCRLISNKEDKKIPQGWATAAEVAEDINNPTLPLIGSKHNYKEGKLFLIKKATHSKGSFCDFLKLCNYKISQLFSFMVYLLLTTKSYEQRKK